MMQMLVEKSRSWEIFTFRGDGSTLFLDLEGAKFRLDLPFKNVVQHVQLYDPAEHSGVLPVGSCKPA